MADIVAKIFFASRRATLIQKIDPPRKIDSSGAPIGEAFKSAATFYATAFHELGHATGHKSRLDRDLRSRFGEKAYAAEELIAELCAAFLCAEFSLDGELRHAGYIQSWSFLGQLERASAELHKRAPDPFLERVEAAVRGKEAISSAALLDLLDVPKTTGNARRVGKTMRSMGFIPIKSRRLMPGGFRDTVTRGWARPIREIAYRTNPTQGEKVQITHLQPNSRLNALTEGVKP
jgi:Zincin-like metallopeptidase